MIISKIILYVSTNDKLAYITYKQTNKFNKIYMLKKDCCGKLKPSKDVRTRVIRLQLNVQSATFYLKQGHV